MIKIGDLIHVPEVKTVVELARVRNVQATEARSQVLLDEIANTFVITDDIKLNLTSILQSIAQNEGKGFFLSGSFGSGKSHFLSVLSLLLTDPHAWPPLLAQEPSLENFALTINKKHYITIQVPLLEHSATETLEAIIFNAIEKTLNLNWGFNLTLAEDEYFLEMFERYILPAFRNDIQNFIQKEIGQSFSWSSLKSEPKDLVTLMRRFLTEKGEEIPFQLRPQRNQAIEKTLQALLDKNFTGMVILLDELSEFLRSKASSAQLNEDARFLQFLGERTQTQPIWVIGALQEAIEKTGDIQKAVFDKIKDRYKTRLELSTRHIRELIDRRLVQKKPDAQAKIKEAYTILKNSFNNIKITQDLFYQIYPVHPESLEILDLSEGLFSQRRGVVDFVHFQLKGDPARHIDGMMDADYLQLLTPDKIFNHFYVQIKENPRTTKLYTLFRDHFQRRIPEIFELAEDADCALKAIKILILLEILPVKQERSVQQLANMILYRSTDLNLGDINYEYFEEAIMKRLEKEVGYLKVQKGAGRFQDIYQVDLASTSRDVMAERIKIYQTSVHGNRREVVETIFPTLDTPLFPWSQILNVETHYNYIKWMNSVREGRAILSDLRNFDSSAVVRILNRLETTEDDFYVIFGYPFDQTEQLDAYKHLISSRKENRFRAGVVAVLPTPLSNAEWETLEIYYATLLVLEDYKNDQTEQGVEIKTKLAEEAGRLKREARAIFDTAYSTGFIYNTQGRIEQSIRGVTDQSFEMILTKVISQPLEMIYPLFKNIAPLDEISSYTVLKELLTQFIQPAVIEDLNFPQFRVLRSALDNIAVPLGIAEIKGRRCILQGDTNYSPGLKAIYEQVDEKVPASYQELYLHLRQSEFGMTTYIFDLLLMVLLRKGHLVAIQNSQTISFYQLQFPLFKYMDRIGRGQLISSQAREKLQILAKNLLKEDLSNYDIEKQEAIWGKFRNFQERASTFLQKINLQIKALKEKHEIISQNLQYSEEALRQLQLVSENINRTLGSRAGLEKLVEKVAHPEELRYSMDQMRSLNQFFEKELYQFEQIHRYIHHPDLFIPDDSKYKELTALLESTRKNLVLNDNLLLESGMNYVQGIYNDFIELYKNHYVREHEAQNRLLDTDKIDQIRQTSGYKTLQQFAQIHLISVKDDFFKINKLLEDYKRKECKLTVSEAIERAPRCTCGFKLGDQIEAINLNEIEKGIENGCRQYLEALQEPNYRQQVEKYVQDMAKIEKPIPAENIQKLFDLKPADDWKDLVSEFSSHINPATIEHLNQSLSGNIVIITRSMDELYEDLINRKYPKEKVQQIFNNWLNQGKSLAGDVYIEIVADGEKK